MMSAVTIKRYDQLSADQWRRVAVTAKRHVKQITGQTCEIGIGRKYSAGKPVGRQLAIRVYLPKNRRRVAQARQVPANFEIRLKRSDGKFDRLRIRSDVESISDYVPTGAHVNVGRQSASAGFLLRWKTDDGEIRWGLATVGHLFDQTRLRIVAVRVKPTITFRCRRLKTPPKRNHMDLAVLEIIGDRDETEAKLLRCGLIESVHPPTISLMSVRQVHRAVMRHKRGRTYPPDGDRGFVGEEVFPDGFQLGSRILDDCVRVGRSEIDTFRQGTSGSAWSIGTRPACLQVGGKETDFREGIGQPFDLCLPWIRSSIASSADVVAVW